MKKTFAVKNVKCGGCANTLKKALKEEFGEIEVNLDKEPREITLELEEEQQDVLKLKLRSLGYPLSTDELSTVRNVAAKAKSYMSCAVGKMD